MLFHMPPPATAVRHSFEDLSCGDTIDGHAAIRAGGQTQGVREVRLGNSVGNTEGPPNESTSTAFYIRAHKAISSCRLKFRVEPKGSAKEAPKVNGNERS